MTTAEAATIVPRSQDAVRVAILRGRLRGTSIDGRWYITRSDLLAWHQRTRPSHYPTRPKPWEAIADLLAEYDSASTEELQVLSGLHIGNVRKYLACLSKEGRVDRRPDGQWYLTPTDAAAGAA